MIRIFDGEIRATDWSSITHSDEIVGKRKRLLEKKRTHARTIRKTDTLVRVRERERERERETVAHGWGTFSSAREAVLSGP